MRLLTLLDDPDSEARDIVPVIEADPAMTARIITLANSAAFGTRTKAANAWAAVMVVGFNVVRALTAAGILGIRAGNDDAPEHYFEHSLASAAGASVVARQTSGRASDAFSAALLHDIGALLFKREKPAQWEEVLVTSSEGAHSSLRAEARVFGQGHDKIAVEVLDYLHFPNSILEAAGQHNQAPAHATSRLSQIVIAGISLAEASGTPSATDRVAPLDEALVALEIAPATANPMLFEQLAEELASIKTILT
jgi:putative nucleotidyltransferase with HDIG domain